MKIPLDSLLIPKIGMWNLFGPAHTDSAQQAVKVPKLQFSIVYNL